MPQPADFLDAVPAMTTAAAAGSDRKNLIIVFLAGGSCAHNTVFPRTGANRAHYESVRPDLALDDNPATAIDADWAFHPSLTGLKELWDLDKLAIIRNVGPLVQPVTHAQYEGGVAVTPPQLYSHSDQQDLWETGIGNQPIAPTGWVGRLAELLVPFNSAAVASPLLSFSGPTDTFRAFDVRQLGLTSSGLPARDGESGDLTAILEDMFASHVDTSPLVQEYVDSHKRSLAATSVVNAALATVTPPVNMPVFVPLGRQMRTALQLAATQDDLGHRRSVYFMTHGGYDHHFDQLNEETARFNDLGPVLREAYTASVDLGISANTTFVVYSEFGRSMRQNGDGTDHGWGGHAFVFGGGVNGGWYGTQPSLDPAGPDIVSSQCHMIPTTPVDTLIASLAKWMGVPDATANGVNPLDLLVPNLPNFPVRDLNLFT